MVMIPQHSSGNTESIGFIDYLKKFIREMPLGTCRELIGVLEVRLNRQILTATEMTAITKTPVSIPTARLKDMEAYAQTLRNCLTVIDPLIDDVGAKTPIGTAPEWTSETEEKAVELFLKTAGW